MQLFREMQKHQSIDAKLLAALKRTCDLITERKDCTLNEMLHWQILIEAAEGKE